MQTVYIYGLYDPRNNELKYVGKAINLANRLRSHIDFARDDISCPKSDWIKELLFLELEPIIFVLEETTEKDWAEAEIRWIADCRARGLNLFNVADGGPNPPDWMGRKQSTIHVQKRVETRRVKGNYSHSEKTKRKISEKKKEEFLDKSGTFFGRKHSEESKQKMSQSSKGQVAWNKGIPLSDEIKSKISNSRKGKPLSDETKQKLSNAHKGQKVTLETRQKLSLANTGKHHSEETKQKLREASLGKTHSEETKQKLSLLAKGRPKSESTKEKLGKAIKKAWEDSEYKERMKVIRKEAQKAKWQDPAYRAKMLDAQKRRRERELLEKQSN